jgi:hypothetical protein
VGVALALAPAARRPRLARPCASSLLETRAQAVLCRPSRPIAAAPADRRGGRRDRAGGAAVRDPRLAGVRLVAQATSEVMRSRISRTRRCRGKTIGKSLRCVLRDMCARRDA